VNEELNEVEKSRVSIRFVLLNPVVNDNLRQSSLINTFTSIINFGTVNAVLPDFTISKRLPSPSDMTLRISLPRRGFRAPPCTKNRFKSEYKKVDMDSHDPWALQDASGAF
jgi:hypothetical protein